MLDIIGAIGTTAIYATVVGVLISFSSARLRVKMAVLGIAAGWAVLIVAITAAGGFRPGVLGPVPGPVVAFIGVLTTLFALWRFSPSFKEALWSVPLPAAVAVNISRLGGVFFLLLHGANRLSAPFATSAGWGDIAVGLLAFPVVILITRSTGYREVTRAWNFLGVLDLLVAVTLGALSAPGTPFRIFHEGPGTLAMTTLPWIIVPTMAVPIFLLNHLLIFSKLRAVENSVAKRELAAVEG